MRESVRQRQPIVHGRKRLATVQRDLRAKVVDGEPAETAGRSRRVRRHAVSANRSLSAKVCAALASGFTSTFFAVDLKPELVLLTHLDGTPVAELREKLCKDDELFAVKH